MNIELQICALAMLVIFYIFIVREKKLNFKNRQLFVASFLSCTVCLILDIASIVCIYFATYSDFSPFWTKFVCKAYIMSLVVQGYAGFLYGCLELSLKHKHKFARYLSLCVCVIGEICIFLSPIDYYMSGQVVYSYGPATLWTYGLAMFYITMTLVFIFLNKKELSHRRLMALFTWQGSWLIAAAIQFFFKGILVVSYAAAFGMIVLYSLLENPNEYIDRLSGEFTMNALIAYLKEKYVYGEKFSMFTARIKYLVPFAGLDMRTDAMRRTAKAFDELGKEPVFCLNDEMFCVIYDDEEYAYQKLLEIKARADGVRDVPAEARFIFFPNSTKLTGVDEIFKFLHIHEDDSNEITVCDDDALTKLRYHKDVYNLVENAMKDDRVVVYYQPIYNVKLKKFTAAEALVRIVDENGNLVPPGQFIPIAEENGQIISLGIRVFEKVCQFLASGKPQELGIQKISVNVSVAQFDHDNPAGFVMEYINKYNVDSKYISLEITETASNDLRHILLNNMERLILSGVSFSLDDFGTGRSNLDYFVDMPVENIKFDYIFTQGYFKSTKIHSIVKGVVEIMHDMGMKIISEGVETEDQLRAMIDMGVEYVQGFYFSRPIPEAEFLDFLHENNIMKEEIVANE